MKNFDFHEKQSLLRCGLHAVNNLLGEQAFDPLKFHKLAEELKQQTQTSHETFCIVSIGNYDINIIQMALQQKHCESKWFNKKVDDHSKIMANPIVIGCLINVKMREQYFYEKYMDWDPRHWYTVKKLRAEKENEENSYLILDSREKQVLIKNEKQIIDYLNSLKDDSIVIYISKDNQQQQNVNE